MLQNLVFFMFAAVLLSSAIGVISARNPVHAVLLLVLSFFNAAGLFVLLGAEFLAMLLVIVYVGAVAVLFLFVVMMLDINFEEMRRGFRRYLPAGALVAVILLAQMLLAIEAWPESPLAPVGSSGNMGDNTRALGLILYTEYALPFQVSGLILLVAMIGAIVLTLRERAGLRRQRVMRQLDRHREEVVTLKKMPSGQGIDI